MEDVFAVADAAWERRRTERGVREGEFRFLRTDAVWRAGAAAEVAAMRAKRGRESGGGAGRSLREAGVSGGEQGARAADGEGYRGGAGEGHRGGGLDGPRDEEAGASEAGKRTEQDRVSGPVAGLLLGIGGAH